MKKTFISLFVLAALFSCNQPSATVAETTPTEESITVSSLSVPATGTKVTNAKELSEAIKKAQPGDNIIMANGVWKDVQIKFTSKGTKDAPITLAAEEAGKVFIEGESYLKLGGEHLIVNGLYFRNGYTPSTAVIDFKKSKTQVANHCRVTNCVIEDFNQPKRDRKDLWVEFFGRHNQIDHCYLAGKSNVGPTLRVEIGGNRNIMNYHKIINNHFGPRPRKGGPKGETIQLGNSFTSMSPSNTIIANNLFEECNGEVEIISSKTNFNIFKNNVFYKSEGSLVTRHGNYCTIDGNYFIGDGANNNYGGIRLINTGHTVTNNYFYNIIGENFRSPLAVMNGIPKSPLNRYNQVTDVRVAFNSFVNCAAPLQFGVGTNVSQADVLPKSEIRSAAPKRTEIANNIIYNDKGDATTVVAHDKIKDITFSNNIINNASDLTSSIEGGFTVAELGTTKVNDYLVLPTYTAENELYNGFGFDEINTDLFGNKRSADNNTVGAALTVPSVDPAILDKTKYGATWFSNVKEAVEPAKLAATNATELAAKIAEAKDGDIITLAAGDYTVTTPLVINKVITINGADKKAQLVYNGAAGTPLFEMNPKGELTLEGVALKGNGTNYAFASLKENMSSLYNLTVNNSEISNFDFVLKAYKETFADAITFTGSTIKDCANGLELSEETNDKGDYNTEFLTINNCEFNNVASNVIDYYRGGYDESTIGGNLIVTNSTFTNSGSKEANKVLLNHRGIVNVKLENNTFKNNPVKFVSVLWGAKNNTEANNTVSNSGKILTEENIKLTLVY